jgi:hypothetical protein
VGEAGVIAIMAGEAFYIFEESGEPWSVPVESVTEMVFFDGD